MAADEVPERQRYQNRLTALKTERNSWDAHYRELAEQIQPRRSRFFQTDRNKGDKKNAAIINGTPTWSARVLSSGMMAGITSPARPWFRLATPDPDLNEFGSVKQWLHVVEERIRQAVRKSNLYNALHSVYSDLSVFGTSVLHVEEDFEDGLRAYVFPVGSYCLANSARQHVDTVYRELSLTVAQVVDQFCMRPGQAQPDWSRVSQRVRNAYERKSFDEWVEVVHIVEPNRQRQMDALGPAGMPFRSCWYESTGDDPSRMLRESGYEEFPAMAPRWNVTGEDVYGYSPGMEALGDCKALQQLEKRKLEVLEKVVRPPMIGPSSLVGTAVSLLPGGFTPIDEPRPNTVRPAVDINPQALVAAESTIREHESRIKQAFFADLWLMLSQSAPRMTAREVAERHEEKMLQLGPVLERLQDELLDPLIERVFGVLQRNGELPPPPEELAGMEMRVDYISILADAQKMLGTTAVERLAGFVGNLAAVKPDVLDKLDTDQMVDEYGDMLGVPPALVRSDEDVQRIRDERAAAQKQAQQMEQAAAMAQGAATLASADMTGDNALTRIANTLGPGAAAQARGLQ